MNWPDFTKRGNAIAILFFLEMFFFVAMFVSFLLPHEHIKLQEVCVTAFTGATAMLALALKLGGPDTPNPPDATSGSATTTSTTTTASATPVTPAQPVTPKPSVG